MISIQRLTDVHLLPPVVNDILGDATASGCSRPPTTAADQQQPAYAWALHRQTLLLWRAEDGLQAVVRRLTLTELPVGATFVEVVTHQQSTAVTVIVCTGAGQLQVWLDANFPAAPFSQRITTTSSTVAAAAAANDGSTDEAGSRMQQEGADARVVRALAASAADSAGNPGFLAVVATADAALHSFHGSQQGVLPRQFHSAASAPRTLQAGVLGAISSAVRAMYEEAFDPLAHVSRSRASAAPALGLQLLPLDCARCKLFVLAEDSSLDCWLLGSLGQQSTEALLWSLNTSLVLRQALEATEVQLLAAAATGSQQGAAPGAGSSGGGGRGSGGGGGGSSRDAATGQQQTLIYTWSAHTDSSSLRYQHAVSCFALEDGAQLPRLLHCRRLGHTSTLPQPQLHMRWQLAPHAFLPSVLLLAHNGSTLEWLRPAAQAQDEAQDEAAAAPVLLGTSKDNLAITCSGASGAWLLFNSKYGVLQVSAGGEGGQEHAPGAGQQLEAAHALLQKVVDLMAKEYAAGCPYRDLAHGLAKALDSFGVLDSEQGWQLLLSASISIVDGLPKPGTLGPSDLRSMLQDKQVRHSLLLTALQEGGVLAQLPAHVTAHLLQHAQMLAAAAAVLQWQRDRQAEVSGEGGDGIGTGAAAGEAVAASVAAITAAGELVAAAGTPLDDDIGSADSCWEVVFARPVVSIPALFQAVAGQAAGIRQALATAAERSVSMAALVAQLLGLSGMLLAAAAAAEAQAAQVKERSMEGALHAAGPSWLAGAVPREAWAQLAQACLDAENCEGSQLATKLQLARDAHLPCLSALLGGLARALQASTPPDGSLLALYEELPWQHGAVLLELARMEVEHMRERGMLDAARKAAAAGDAASDAFRAANRALVWRLQALAMEHRCHQLLFEVLELVDTLDLLPPQQTRAYMARDLARTGRKLAPGSFTYYVMQRLLQDGFVEPLLRLGQMGFQAQLQQFLAPRPRLLWMSQVQTGDVAGAAASLALAADEAGEGATGAKSSLAQARRLLCLARIAAHAAGPALPAADQVMGKAGVRLRQLALQQELQPDLDVAAPMSTQQLAMAALAAAAAGQRQRAAAGLSGGGAAVAAVEALALDPEQRASDGYRQLWDAAWKAVLQHTPLQELAAQDTGDAAQRWHSDAYRLAAEGCAVYQAVVRAAAALAAARELLADVSPQQQLSEACAGLMQEVQASGAWRPDAPACLHDILGAAFRAAGLQAARA